MMPSPAALWNDARAVLAARWYLRAATELGKRVRIYGHPAISNHGTLTVADRVRLISTIATLEIAVGPKAKLEIGSRTFVNYGCSIAATQSIRIGAQCNIGTHVILMDNDFHRLEPERRDERPPSAPIVLGDNVWLCGRVIVLPGVTIGDGSVVAAGSIVTRSVPPRTLVGGVPARVIREL